MLFSATCMLQICIQHFSLAENYYLKIINWKQISFLSKLDFVCDVEKPVCGVGGIGQVLTRDVAQSGSGFQGSSVCAWRIARKGSGMSSICTSMYILHPSPPPWEVTPYGWHQLSSSLPAPREQAQGGASDTCRVRPHVLAAAADLSQALPRWPLLPLDWSSNDSTWDQVDDCFSLAVLGDASQSPSACSWDVPRGITPSTSGGNPGQ